MRNNGQVDGRDKDFRTLLTASLGKQYRVNMDGTADMRYTRNPLILQMKLDKLLNKK